MSEPPITSMSDVFITAIQINEVRNLRDFRIPLSNQHKQNLIVTGKNGSGKTTLLNHMKMYLNQIVNGQHRGLENVIDNFKSTTKQLEEESYQPMSDRRKTQLQDDLTNYTNFLQQFGGTSIEFSNSYGAQDLFTHGKFIVAFFEAKRNTSLKVPTGINKINVKPVYGPDEHAGHEFIQYIVNLKADRSFARDEDDVDTVKKVDEWFSNFESSLVTLFGSDNLKLVFDRKQYNFNILEEGKLPYNLNQLSGGYSAILSIVTELIMRMEEHKSKNYDVQGVVLIDEIETHLHMELQKKILPFLTSFFPKIQFIVTTHSPFVLSSITDAVICDLEKRIVTSDLSGYSYDTIIESYFDSDKYSETLKEKIAEYENLRAQESLSEADSQNLLNLKFYLNEIPKFVSDELAVKLQQIKLKHLKPRKDDLQR